MKKILPALLGASVLLTGCGIFEDRPVRPGIVEDEGEDCDAEDFANREAECGFSQKKTSKPRTTRR